MPSTNIYLSLMFLYILYSICLGLSSLLVASLILIASQKRSSAMGQVVALAAKQATFSQEFSNQKRSGASPLPSEIKLLGISQT